jgi:hypothetical protein
MVRMVADIRALRDGKRYVRHRAATSNVTLRRGRDYLMWRWMPTSRSGQRATASSADRRGLRVLACAK